MVSIVPPATIISHWHKLIENLETSSLDFYAAIEQALKLRQVPDAATSRIDWQEGGLLSAKREYLRIKRGRNSFDICAAPFGAGFFVSWWLGEPRPSPIIPTVVALVVLGYLSNALSSRFGYVRGLLFAIVDIALVLGAIGFFTREGKLDAYVRVIPLVGTLYESLFRPSTYYRIDTALMFQSAVHAAVLEVIDGHTEAKGLRGLSELERKPILREFYK